VTAPDWHSSDFPELRAGPPWVMQEMMARQPELAAEILTPGDAAVAAVADAVRAAAAGEQVTVTGCGTSEHAAHGVAALLAAALPTAQRRHVRAVPALSATLEPQAGCCIAVSHDGGTRATLLALEAAGRAGARAAAITAKPDGAVPQAAEHAIVTPLRDRSWCHTVGYTSAIVAGAAVAARLGLTGVSPGAASRALADGLAVTGADVEQGTATFEISCTSGTYVRTLIHDLATTLGSNAYLTALRRHTVGHLTLGTASTPEDLDAETITNRIIQPIEVVSHLPAADVAAGARRDGVCNGRRLGRLGVEGSCRVMCEGELLAIYRDEGDGARAEVVLCAG